MELTLTKRTDTRLLSCMSNHYSKPKGFVGRNICYAITHQGVYYGHIVGGSATLHLKNRNEFFNISKSDLIHIVNNIFFHIEKVNNKYPFRNFSTKCIQLFRQTIIKDWLKKYGDKVYGFETLIELPRLGTCYKKDNWIEIGLTHGYTCKRIAGKGTDSWSGKRIWNTKNLRPKRILVRKP